MGQVAAIVGGLTYGVAKNVTIHPVKVRRRRSRCPDGLRGGDKWQSCKQLQKH